MGIWLFDITLLGDFVTQSSRSLNQITYNAKHYLNSGSWFKFLFVLGQNSGIKQPSIQSVSLTHVCVYLSGLSLTAPGLWAFICSTGMHPKHVYF